MLHMSKKLLFAVVLLVLPAALIFSAPETEGAKETLVYATTEKVSYMDPSNAYDFHTWELFRNIGVGLLAYKPGTTELVPGLAED